MWNGLWKLTAMVCVVGVGLFAAYQAQKGMNLGTVAVPGDSAVEDGNERVAMAEDDPIANAAADLQIPSLSDIDADPVKPVSRRVKKKEEPRVDPLDDFAEPQADNRKAVAAKKVPGQVIPVKRTQRQQGVDFRAGAEVIEEELVERSAEPQQLAEDDEPQISTKKPTKPIRQVNAEMGDSAPGTLEVEVDPFAVDVPASKDAATATPQAATKAKVLAALEEEFEAPPEKSQVEVQAEEAVVEPPVVESPQPAGRAKISADFGAAGDPPRSKRAKQTAVKRVEAAADLEDDVFGRESQPPAQPIPDSVPTGDSLEIGAPQSIEPPPRAEPLRDRNPRPATAPRTLPGDPSAVSADEVPAPRSQPSRNRPQLPAQLPDDAGDGFLSESPARSRDAQSRDLQSRDLQSRKSDYDKVTPVDMTGDGVIGDASQQGIQQPRLTIEKVVKQQAVLEQPLIYTIIVKNVGTVDAHNVVVEDRIPKGTELQGTSPQAELSGKRLIWNHLLLKPNEEKRISIKVIPKQEGPIGSVARVYFATEVSAEIVVAAPQLEFTVKAPSEVRIGQHFDLVFNLKNVGTVDASNVKVQDLVPEQLKHEAGTDIECPIGKMAPNEAREIVLPVIATKTGTVTNRAILTADSGVKKTLDSNIDIVGEVLILTRSGQSRLYVERTAEFVNNIRNDGNQKADRVRIAEAVPAGMEFESATDGGKYDSNLRAVVWTVGPLAPGNDKSVKVKFVPKETGTLAAKITATGSAGSTAAIQSAIEVIGKPELQMETLSATGAVTVGDRVTSKFQLSNTGTAAANNVQLRIKLPRELRLISVKGAKFQQRDDYVQFEVLGELAPRSKAAYELVLEPIAEADAQIGLEISADHLAKPGRRVETIQIARDALR